MLKISPSKSSILENKKKSQNEYLGLKQTSVENSREIENEDFESIKTKTKESRT